MGKGEIARYEQFLLFPQCFQKASFPEASKGIIMWEWVNQRKTFRRIHFEPPFSHLSNMVQPFPKREILDCSKLKKFADDNVKFDENGSKFSKKIAKTVVKREIARYEQFLLFLQCFQKTYFADS